MISYNYTFNSDGQLYCAQSNRIFKTKLVLLATSEPIKRKTYDENEGVAVTEYDYLYIELKFHKRN